MGGFAIQEMFPFQVSQGSGGADCCTLEVALGAAAPHGDVPTVGTLQPGVGHQTLGTSTGAPLGELQERNAGRHGVREVSRLPKCKSTGKASVCSGQDHQ